MKRLFVLLLVVGMALGLSISSVSTDKKSYAPGESGYITIVLTNANTASVDDITIQLNAGGNVALGTTILDVGDLGPASSTTINIPITVSKTAPSGMYFVTIQATGRIKSVTPVELKKTESVAAIKIARSPVLSISMDKTELGKETAVVLTICNEGGDANDMVATLSGDIGFTGADSIFIGDVGRECKKVNANLDAKRAEDGRNALMLTLSYKDELGGDRTEKKEIGVVVNKREGDFSIEQTSMVQTKTETVLRLRITNAGNDARNVKISFTDDSIRLVGKNKIDAGNIARGESKEIEADVYVNAKPGITSAGVRIEWEENGEKKEDEIKMPIKVKSDADVGIYIEAKPAPLRANGEHTLSITVANLGSYAIGSVSISVQSDAFELQEAQAEKYIGGLEYDDFSSEQFKVRVKNVEPGSYPINITVVYRDYSGEWVTKKVEEKLLIEGAVQEGGNNTALLVILGLVVIAGAYYFLKIRKKSRA
jgi:LPXTG-motif cell wall-anchored protein